MRLNLNNEKQLSEVKRVKDTDGGYEIARPYLPQLLILATNNFIDQFMHGPKKGVVENFL